MELSPWRFHTLMLAVAAAASIMAAEGVQTFAEMAERNSGLRARRAAASPVPYRTLLPALHALVPATNDGLRIIVRADSAEAASTALCNLAASRAAAEIRWVALSGELHPCLARNGGAVLLRPEGSAREEIGTARWIVLDARGAAVHSSREVPSAKRMRSIAALLGGAPAS